MAKRTQNNHFKKLTPIGTGIDKLNAICKGKFWKMQITHN